MRLLLNLLTFLTLVVWLVSFLFFNFGWGVHGLLLLAADIYLIKLILIEMSKRKEAKENIHSS